MSLVGAASSPAGISMSGHGKIAPIQLLAQMKRKQPDTNGAQPTINACAAVRSNKYELNRKSRLVGTRQTKMSADKQPDVVSKFKLASADAQRSPTSEREDRSDINLDALHGPSIGYTSCWTSIISTRGVHEVGNGQPESTLLAAQVCLSDVVDQLLDRPSWTH